MQVRENGLASADTFFDQVVNFEVTHRQIVEGELQILVDEAGIKTFGISDQAAWERRLSDDVMCGTFPGAGFYNTDVEPEPDRTVDRGSFALGTDTMAEPIDNLPADGLLFFGLGYNELALRDDKLESTCSSRSLLIGGVVSGAVSVATERETFESRPELSVADLARSTLPGSCRRGG